MHQVLKILFESFSKIEIEMIAVDSALWKIEYNQKSRTEEMGFWQEHFHFHAKVNVVIKTILQLLMTAHKTWNYFSSISFSFVYLYFY